MKNIEELIFSALATLIILSIHEFAHAYAAHRLGDNTAKNLGRLSLNPIKHLDPIGAICMVLFHFGWAKPVPINARNFKNPKRDFAITALAGPTVNLICAFFSAFLYLLTFALLRGVTFESKFLLSLAENTLLFLYLFHLINIGLGIFNLVPIPPLDGSRLLTVILPTKTYFKIMKYERNIYFAVIGWLLLGDYAKHALLSIPLVASNQILSFIASIFSLTDILAKLFSFVSGAMLDFWQLIPYLKA